MAARALGGHRFAGPGRFGLVDSRSSSQAGRGVSLIDLSSGDRALLADKSTAFAMRLVVATAEQMGADHLLDITSAHIDSCLFHGQAGLDFARGLVESGAKVAVPATLNVALLDLLHPDLYRGDPETAASGRELMDAYVALGCTPTWTCAPYQQVNRPRFGEQVAWAESNAIVFVNSVLGARSNRYGDFIDIACAITGRAPASGLHLDEGRVPTLHIDVVGALSEEAEEDWFYSALGYLVGERAGSEIAIITGLPTAASEDRLKALGAAAATSGSVGLVHVLGSTPEAEQFADIALARTVVTREMVDGVKRRLTTATGRVDAVCLGAPHYSRRELAELWEALAGRSVRVPTYVNTSRDQLAKSDSVLADLEAAGVTIVTDTCTYITPIIDPLVKSVMTDSVKWAYYAPGNLGVSVVLGSLAECVKRAVDGG